MRYMAGLQVLTLVSTTLFGCAGATPNLSPPQMQNPGLGNAPRSQSQPVADASLGVKSEDLPPSEEISAKPGTFFTQPYVQFLPFEADPKTGSGILINYQLTGMNPKSTLSIEWRPAGSGEWKSAKGPKSTKIWGPAGVDAHTIIQQQLTGLPAGAWVDYRFVSGKETVFQSRCKTRPAAGQSQKVVIFGDCGAGTPESKLIAMEASKIKADYAVLTGDIVYSKGRASEYQTNFWPIFNANTADPKVGGPLLRSTVTVPAPGNHDIRSTTLDKFQDGFAYFLYWGLPTNGYNFPKDSKSATQLGGDAALQATYKAAAGDAFPNAANYSITVGDVHWTILDANPNVEWTDAKLLAWLEADLAAAAKSPWRFVAFHHPPFNSSVEHFTNQWMRVLSETFHKHKVQMIWNGHVHNYQRTHPLVFHPTAAVAKDGTVAGTFDLDQKYDPVKGGKPSGEIYVITGAGGAGLYKKVSDKEPKLQPFTSKLVNDIHSFTVADITREKLVVRQIDANGKELDSFIVQREEKK